jgi:hypothetical protein
MERILHQLKSTWPAATCAFDEAAGSITLVERFRYRDALNGADAKVIARQIDDRTKQ